MKLITELNEDTHYITERSEDGKNYRYITEIVLLWLKKNKNGRMYPMDVLENEVSRYVREVVNMNRAYGELNHPSGPTINLQNVSHIITELKKTRIILLVRQD
jgi:phosphopantetheine adenylyltransferase